MTVVRDLSATAIDCDGKVTNGMRFLPRAACDCDLASHPRIHRIVGILLRTIRRCSAIKGLLPQL